MSVSLWAGAAAGGAGSVQELLVELQGRLAGRPELGVLRQKHRQFLLRHGNHAAAVAVEHGNGRAPVALAGDEPVPQPVGDRATTPAVGLDVVGDALLAFGHGQAIEGAGVHLRPVLHESLLKLAASPVRQERLPPVYPGRTFWRTRNRAGRERERPSRFRCRRLAARSRPRRWATRSPLRRLTRVGAGEDARFLPLRGEALHLRLPTRLLYVGVDLRPAVGGVVSLSTRGCSGAMTTNVTP